MFCVLLDKLPDCRLRPGRQSRRTSEARLSLLWPCTITLLPVFAANCGRFYHTFSLYWCTRFSISAMQYARKTPCFSARRLLVQTAAGFRNICAPLLILPIWFKILVMYQLGQFRQDGYWKIQHTIRPSRGYNINRNSQIALLHFRLHRIFAS